jgi:hypothetical protein
MQWRSVAWQGSFSSIFTAGLTLLGAGAALAATSGWPVDQPINSTINFVCKDIGAAVFFGGLAGWGSHVMTGHDLGKLTEHAGKMMIAGGALNQGPAVAGVTGLSPAAMLNPHDPYSMSLWILLATNLLLMTGLTVGTVGVRRLYAKVRHYLGYTGGV